ncbi:MAG: alpha-L-fucosidase [Puniceicoccales bacterium]|nr:alpha-L-fucosidase [Puniceicoccales bacterium]
MQSPAFFFFTAFSSARRRFARTAAALLATAFALDSAAPLAAATSQAAAEPQAAAAPFAAPAKPVLPTPQQVLWHEMEQTMFVCLDPCSWQGREYDNHSTPLEKIKLEKLDVNQWIDAAEAFDAKLILFVAKHAGGFCWWQTETSDYSIKNTAYKNGKGDVLDELAKACFKRGMKLGIYISPNDTKHGAGNGGKINDPAKQAAYAKVLRRQWEEVLSRYGKQIVEVWFDGGVVIPLEDVIRKHTPQSIVFQGPFADIRWVGNERGFCPYPNWYTLDSKAARTGGATAEHSRPDGDAWLPVEVDTTLRNHFWFWNKANEKSLRSLDNLMSIYYQSVGRGALLLLNSAPDTTGLIPLKDMELYRAFGKEVRRRFGKSIAETSGNGNTLELRLEKSAVIDHVIIQEDLALGQRIRKYDIEGFSKGAWRVLARGLSVGQKRIEQFAPVEVSAVRLRVVESSFPAVIRRLAVFNTGAGKLVSVGGAALAKPEKAASEVHIGNNGNFSFDLSPFIPLAEQYVLRFRAGNSLARPTSVSLWIEGVELANKAEILSDGSVRINITGYPSMKKNSIIIKGNFGKRRGRLALSVQ